MIASPTEPKTAEAVKCYHCGADCPEPLLIADDKPFCCDGCKTVYTLLNDSELCQYYRLDQHPGVSPDKEYYAGKFAYVDLPQVREKLIDFADENRTSVTFYTPGMHCSSCIYLLENLHRLHPGVLSAVVNFPERKVRILFQEATLSLSELADLLTRIGYEPYISLHDLDGKQQRRQRRRRLAQIGVAGFAFGNIMMMSFPEYFAVGEWSKEKSLGDLFVYLNLLLSLPVLLFSAQDFFTSAWQALRGRYLNIDAPIVLSILITFSRSLYEVATHTGPGYFDSMTGIVFFLLIGRYLQDRTYARLSFERDYTSYFPLAATVKQGPAERRVPVTELQTGDRLYIRNQELIPADARLLSPEAMIDYSFVTGESEPVSRQVGELLYAGGRLVGQAAEMDVVKPVSQSYLTQLWNHDAFRNQDADAEAKRLRSSLPDKINRYFTPAVFTISLSSFLFWTLQGQVLLGLNAATAVLIVVCPCILLLAHTFTDSNLVGIFGRYGLYLRQAGVIEKLTRITAVVFDKTGTLTQTNASTVHWVSLAEGTEDDNELADELKSIVRALTGHSVHPYSRRIAGWLDAWQRRVPLKNFREVAGSGIEAMVDGQRIRLGSAGFVGYDRTVPDTAGSHTFLAVDQYVLGYFSIRNPYRNGVEGLVQQLDQENIAQFVLSGDRDADRTYLTRLFGKADHLHFLQKPDDKLRVIQGLQQKGAQVLMVGDGLNDAGALQQSELGIAVSDDLTTFSPACDAIVQGDQLVRLPQYIKLARAGMWVLKFCFGISLLYNFVGISVAVQGHMAPVVAAILMPATSLTVILLSTITSNIIAKRLFKKL